MSPDETNILLEIQRSIGRLEGKVDQSMMATASQLSALAISVQTGEKRIRSMELHQARYAGAATILGAIFGWIANYFSWHYHT